MGPDAFLYPNDNKDKGGNKRQKETKNSKEVKNEERGRNHLKVLGGSSIWHQMAALIP